MTETATLTSKGQLTVPKAVREAMGLKPGDRLTFREEADGRWTIERRTRDFRDLIGILAKYAGPTPVGPEDIEAARAEEYEARAARSAPEAEAPDAGEPQSGAGVRRRKRA